MEIKYYLQMMSRSWWIIVLTVIAAVIAALLFSYLSIPVYQTSARFIVSPDPEILSSENSVLNSLDILDKRSVVNTYSEVLKSSRILQQTALYQNLGEAGLKRYSYSAVTLPDTNIIVLTVKGPDPLQIVRLANDIGGASISYIEGLYPVYSLLLLDPAATPLVPILPQPFRNAAIALVLGVALGSGLAFLRELLRTPFESFLKQSALDGMSSALNRRSFEQKLAQISQGPGDHSLCMVQLEGLNGFSEVLPQPTLQHVLRSVTQSLKDQLRGNDLIGRWDENQFAVLLSGTRGIAAYNTMCRVYNALSVPVKTDGTGEAMDLKPKIGIAENSPEQSPEELVQQAELALKTALNNGKDIKLGS